MPNQFHISKTYWGVAVYIHAFLNLGPTLWQSCLQCSRVGHSPRDPFDKKLSGLHCQSGPVERKEVLCPAWNRNPIAWSYSLMVVLFNNASFSICALTGSCWLICKWKLLSVCLLRTAKFRVKTDAQCCFFLLSLWRSKTKREPPDSPVEQVREAVAIVTSQRCHCTQCCQILTFITIS